LSNESKKKISALVVVVVVVARLLNAVFEVVVARHLLDAVVVVVAEITNCDPSPAPSWGPSPRSSPSPSCPRPTESHQRLWGERDVRPTILNEEAEEHDRDGPRLPKEGGQAVAKKARGGVAGTTASCVSGIAAHTRREPYGNSGLAARGAWVPAPSSPAASGAIVAKKARGGVAGTTASCVLGIAAHTRREPYGNSGLGARGAWVPAPSSPAASGRSPQAHPPPAPLRAPPPGLTRREGPRCPCCRARSA